MFQTSVTPALVSALFLLASQDVPQSGNPSLTISTSSLSSGGHASIAYSNAALANQTVIIDIDNGMRRDPLTAFVEIELDANGVGSATWLVPKWLGANFNAPGVSEVHRVIL